MSGLSSRGHLSVEAIESQLNELWKGKAEAGTEQEAVVRACVLNLLVCTAGGKNAERLTETVAEITIEHPSRVIVVHFDPQAEPDIGALVSAHCHLAARTRQQICCEQITITAGATGIQHIPSMARALLVPDLPVFLWWHEALDGESPLLNQLTKTADRIIADSTSSTDPRGGLGNVLSLMDEGGRWTAFSDLSWARLTPWRALVAGLFGIAEYRDLLRGVGSVEIECRSSHSRERVIPGPALLLAGWMASRLKWEWVSDPHWIDSDTQGWELKSNDRVVSVRCRICEADDVCASLHSVRLMVEQPLATFDAAVGSQGRCLESSVSLEHRDRTGPMVRLNEPSDAELLGRELEILGHDAVYEESLRFLSPLVS